MKLAVVGTGYWGKNHVRALKELLDEGKISHLSICDTDEKRADEIAQHYGIPYCTSSHELSDDVDGVVIATPSDTHHALAKEFLAAGKDVLVEKPMTLHSRRAEELIQIAEKNECILMVGHIFRYHSAVNEIKRRITRGDFGSIYYMMSNRFSLRYPRKDMGVLFALGIHEVDVFCYLMDQPYPEELFATVSNYIGKTEETAQIITYFKGGATGYAFESWITPVYGKRRELVVVGSRMSARIDYLKPNEITFFDATISPETVSQEDSYVIPIEYREPLKEELLDFITCMKTRKQPVANMHIGKAAVEMIEKAMESAKEGRKIRL